MRQEDDRSVGCVGVVSARNFLVVNARWVDMAVENGKTTPKVPHPQTGDWYRQTKMLVAGAAAHASRISTFSPGVFM